MLLLLLRVLLLLQRRDRFTHRYCMRWHVSFANGKLSLSCAVSVTAKDALREVYRNVPKYAEHARARSRAQARARARSVTLGGVGVMEDLEDLLLGVEDWNGPKVRGNQMQRKCTDACEPVLLTRHTFLRRDVGFSRFSCRDRVLNRTATVVDHVRLWMQAEEQMGAIGAFLPSVKNAFVRMRVPRSGSERLN